MRIAKTDAAPQQVFHPARAMICWVSQVYGAAFLGGVSKRFFGIKFGVFRGYTGMKGEHIVSEAMKEFIGAFYNL